MLLMYMIKENRALTSDTEVDLVLRRALCEHLRHMKYVERWGDSNKATIKKNNFKISENVLPEC